MGYTSYSYSEAHSCQKIWAFSFLQSFDFKVFTEYIIKTADFFFSFLM